MTLAAGSVTVADDATASGTGLAKAIYDALAADLSADLTGAAASDKAAALRGVARLATPLASAIVSYFTANATVDLSTVVALVSAGGLQNLPSSLTAGNPTDAPSAPVDVPVGRDVGGTLVRDAPIT